MRETSSKKARQRRPADTLEGRENQLVSLSFDLVERQIENGTVSSQALVHFLKLGSTREKLEQQRLLKENLLLSAKVDQLASAKRIEELYEQALSAMRTYAGRDVSSYDED